VSAPAALEAEGVSVRLGGRTILEGVSLTVAPGEFACLCGPNGGGKTTFLKVALGLLPMSEGSVRIFGRTPSEARSQVGYVPQRTAFDRDFPATCGELVVANLRGSWPMRLREAERAVARATLRRVGGEHLLDRDLSRLSGGENQRAFLARALVREPSLLLLDEPTAGVDAQGRAEFLELLTGIAREGRVACLLVTHNRTTVEKVSRRVFYLDRRVVAEGSATEVLGPGSGELGDHTSHTPLCEEE
jgi:ABC-type Mn2+/Zn2+ transport system ATPase subunit